MKITGLNTISRGALALALAAVVLGAFASIGQAQMINARPLTHQEIKDYSLPAETTHPSGGLMTVGVGEPIYLEILVEKGTTVSGVTWSVIKRPLADPPSTADFQASPITANIPAYEPNEKAIYDAFGRTMFSPDAVGQFEIKAVVNASSGTVELTAKLTGAHYTGVGTIGSDPGTKPVYPQCALCHSEKAATYMGTGHASFFPEAIDGIKSSHYNEGCIDCHVLGGNNPMADNGSFFDVARQTGWTFPERPAEGEWAAMPAELQAKASIQCEHCHGAGSAHLGDVTKISATLESGACAHCHYGEPDHTKKIQWNNSGHANQYYRNSSGCVRCHSGRGFIDTIEGKDVVSTEKAAISCAVCHDPHEADNPSQLRTVEEVILTNGEVVTLGGVGKMCMNCHQSRRVAEEEVGTEPGTVRHFGPHYSTQADILMGTNMYEYDGKVKGLPSAHLNVTNACATCHMQEPARTDPWHNKAGRHPFKIVWYNDTPDDASDDVDLVGACQDCHGEEIQTFADFELVDYNYDGVIESVQEEVHHLLDALGVLLPPVGDPHFESVDGVVYSVQMKKAMWNYAAAEEDHSFGMHNPRYVTAALKASINDLKDPFQGLFAGINIPVGGDWFYSKWFEFYAPQASPGWIYHFEHGHLYVTGDTNTIYLYDHRTGTWRYTNEDLYPLMYDISNSKWLYYGGRFDGVRYFYDYGTGGWTGVN